MNKKSKAILTVEYVALMGTFWAAFCAVIGFVAVILDARGFTGTQIGVAIAIGNILSALVQPVIMGVLDRSKKVTIQMVTAAAAVATALSFGMIAVFPTVFGLVFAMFVLTDALMQLLQPLTNSISIYYVNNGVNLNFGIPRSAGSICYAAASAALGALVKTYGSNIAIISGSVLLLCMAVIAFVMPKCRRDDRDNVEKTAERTALQNTPKDNVSKAQKKEKAYSGGNFITKYNGFLIFLIGIVFIFVFHNGNNSYLKYIVETCGGDSESMGTALAIAAVVELPPMLLFSKIVKKLDCGKLLCICAVCYVLKGFGHYFCTSVTMLYFVQAIQLGTFAIYCPASVFYINEIMEDADKYKGQASIGAAAPIGGVIGSLAGGFILDKFGVSTMNLTFAIATVIGAVCIFIGVITAKKQRA